jgi:hypothetical protein
MNFDRRSILNALTRITLLLAAVVALSGCVAYAPYGPSTYDRSWSALTGALQDQGAQITRSDRTAGVIEARIGERTVTASILTQADGSVRVAYNTSDQGLANRISSAYEARMGR